MDSRFVEGTYGLLIRRNAWLPREGPQLRRPPRSSCTASRQTWWSASSNWRRGITEAAKAFPGYQATDVYPPADSRQAEWVVVIHFDGPENLQRWLGSPVRTEWVEKLRKEMGDFRLKTLPAGFGAWFAGLVDEPEMGCPRRGK